MSNWLIQLWDLLWTIEVVLKIAITFVSAVVLLWLGWMANEMKLFSSVILLLKKSRELVEMLIGIIITAWHNGKFTVSPAPREGRGGKGEKS